MMWGQQTFLRKVLEWGAGRLTAVTLAFDRTMMGPLTNILVSEQTIGRSMSKVVVHRENSLLIVYWNMDVLQKYLDYQVFLVWLNTYANSGYQALLPLRKGPGYECLYMYTGEVWDKPLRNNLPLYSTKIYYCITASLSRGGANLVLNICPHPWDLWKYVCSAVCSELLNNYSLPCLVP